MERNKPSICWNIWQPALIFVILRHYMSDVLWTKERLDLLISQQFEENFQLDYKAAPALTASDHGKNEITKDVSAFANSNGGTIIYGVKEYAAKDREHLPEKIDPVDGSKISREWLDQVCGQIAPRIPGLRIIPVRIGPVSEACYVIEIPQGETAHQARDLRYYRRHNFESVALRDHEIRDIMNRKKVPKLEFRVLFSSNEYGALKMLFQIKNGGAVLPVRYGLVVLLPTILNKMRPHRDNLLSNPLDGLHYWRVDIAGVAPVFPQTDIYISEELPNTMKDVPKPPGDRIICTLFADEMTAVRREFTIDAVFKGWT